MGSMWGMIAKAGLTAAETTLNEEALRMQRLNQAEALDHQARLTEKQAERAALQGRSEAERIDAQKSLLRRQFREEQGRNRAALGAGNVDMASGSAMDVAEGNISRLGSELADNAYNVALKRWESGEQEKALRHQAALYDAQGSYIKKTSGSLGLSLLTGLHAGGMSMLGNQSLLSSHGGQGSGLNWDRALQSWTSSMPRH